MSAAPLPKRWSGRSRGTSLGFGIFAYAMRVLGRRGVYVMLWFVVAYYVAFARAARRHSAAYLRRVLGDRPWWRRQADTWRHFRAMGRAIVDAMLLRVRGPGVFQYTEDNLGAIRAAYQAGKGVILLSAHVGSRTVAGALLEGMKLNLVIYDNEAAGIRRFLGESDGAVGERPSLIVVGDRGRAALEILGALRRGEIVAILADRAGLGPTLRLPFLGEDADFPLGPFKLAVLARAPVLVSFSRKEGASRHHFYAREVPCAPPGATRQKAALHFAGCFVRELELYVRQSPYEWYNLYDFWGHEPS